jgi:hypothetical protein
MIVNIALVVLMVVAFVAVAFATACRNGFKR